MNDHERDEKEDVDCWDLDHTLLDSYHSLFEPIVQEVARHCDVSFAEAHRTFVASNEATFSFQGWFQLLGVSLDERRELEECLKTDVAARAKACLYPGIVEVIARRAEVARQVLITAGDFDFQSWKFGLLDPLLPFFKEEDRHVVPLRGSKASVIAKYAGRGQLAFIDDTAHWHVEALERDFKVVLIRPLWTDFTRAKTHEFDNVRWHTANNANDIFRLLRGGG